MATGDAPVLEALLEYGCVSGKPWTFPSVGECALWGRARPGTRFPGLPTRLLILGA